MRLSPSDHRLSMRISPRPHGEDSTALRTLLVHRLRRAAKAVVRLPLAKDAAAADKASAYTVFCEPCGKWFALPAWGEEIECPRCERLFVLEFAVLTAAKVDKTT
ncbi:hypothetical protein [Streptomyces albidoflavus]|uniref:hypothetical protein n=1 Tax=Streptomyces albidoflavus TaxID=1886 RepID=UPI0033D12ACF